MTDTSKAKQKEKDYNVGMEGESDSGPKGKRLYLPEGDYKFKIVGLEFVEKSQAGNPYFIWKLQEEKTGGVMEQITTLKKGSRWLLKQLLSAVGIEATEGDPEQRYSFDYEDVEGECITGTIKNEKQKPFTGRNGELVTDYEKSVIVKFTAAIPF